MLPNKRIILLCGHYGSGKTSVAVELAKELKKTYERVTLADLDIVNPYFRSKDSEKELTDAGIRFICSPWANSNVDIPALPDEIYAITHDRSHRVVMDIGGDDRGALALGRLSPAIREENNYEMLAVVNCYRPLTRDADSTIEVLREIEVACGIPFTGIINNSSLGALTEKEDILASIPYANEISFKMNLPILLTSVGHVWYDKMSGDFPDLFPLHLRAQI